MQPSLDRGSLGRKLTCVRLWASLACSAFAACGVDAEPPPVTRPPAALAHGCDDRPAARGSLRLRAWDLDVPLEHWDALHAEPFGDVHVDATVCVERHAYPIQLRLHGGSSRHADKKSYQLKFNRGERLSAAVFPDLGDDPGYRKVILKALPLDNSLIREALAFDLWREMGHDAPRVGFVNLRINGAYWGLYQLVEPIDEDYLARHGYPAGGRLYKATREYGSEADFEPGRDLGLAFENKSSNSPPPYEDLEALVAALQDTPLDEAAFLREIDAIFPIDQYFERMIWVSFTQNGDATAQNYFLYNAPADGRDFWHQLPWDSNLCFGASWRDRDLVNPPRGSLLIDGRNHFGRRLMKIGALRERYVERFLATMDDTLREEVVRRVFERHARTVEHDLELDRQRWGRSFGPARAFAVIEDFMAKRPAILRGELAELLGDRDDEPSDQDEVEAEDEDDDHDEAPIEG